MSILKRIFGDYNEKFLKEARKIVEEINSLEPKIKKLSNDKLKERILEFKQESQKIKSQEEMDYFLSEILPEIFALVREASLRTLFQRHFDVQLIGGIGLHQGRVVEMLTGEGKTLAATLPAALNTLSLKGVHIITVNDYLARRDAVWMGQIYHCLGLTVSCLNHEQSFLYDPSYKKPEEEKEKLRDELGGFYVIEDFLKPCSRKEAYSADIVYGTNHEFGFDYLRDNLAYRLEDGVQRKLNFAIVDEVDSILIDEARTPLIISAPDVESSNWYQDFAQIIPKLSREKDYEIDEKSKTASLTEQGIDKIERILGVGNIYENKGIRYLHHLEQALKAEVFFKRDKDYIVKDGKIVIVDEFTGRLMPGRRWSGGLHQAIEAKEKVEVNPESITLASITFQNYFRMYKKLAGMTGTAATAAEEFNKVYNLEVVKIPPNKPMIRKDFPDKVYKTEEIRFKAVIEEIKERHKKGQPILVGTRSVERNEYLGKLLEREGIPCQILNAKNHQKEGEIIAQAGKIGAVTIATNMAGRGVDIILGGNPPSSDEAEKVREFGGLYVIGTETHEDRRIDNQLRGRAGRQGDSGSSCFFVSLEDDFIRIFGGERIKGLMETLKFPEDQPIENKMISNAIQSAQRKIEGMNFDMRKHLLDYDNVMNKHREKFYSIRKDILTKSDEDLKNDILRILKKFGYQEEDYFNKEKEIGTENMRKVERFFYLRTLDSFWQQHLEDMGILKDSVGLRAYGRQEPLVEYKIEGHKRFQGFLETIEKTIADSILKIQITEKREGAAQPPPSFKGGTKEISEKKAGTSRNAPCPCGSGKKYKKCCWSKQ